MKIALSLLLVLLMAGPSYSSDEKVHGGSELAGIVNADPEPVLGKEVLSPPCWVDVPACNKGDEDPFVVHAEGKQTYNSEEFSTALGLMLFGITEDSRKARGIGNGGFGVYQRHMENPPSEHRRRDSLISVLRAWLKSKKETYVVN